MKIFIYTPSKSDSDAWRVKEEGAKCGKYTIYPCKHLTAWIRVKEYIIRYQDLIWFLGGKVDETPVITWEGRGRYHTNEVAARLEELLGGEDLIEACNRMQDMFGNERECEYIRAQAFCTWKNVSRKEYLRMIPK